MQKLISALIVSTLAVSICGAAELPKKKIIVNGQGQSAGTSDLLQDQPLPNWVWGKDQGKTQFVRSVFEAPADLTTARVIATCDNVLTIWINGKQVGRSESWETPVNIDVFAQLAKGSKNVIAIKAENQGGQAGLIAKLILSSKAGKREIIMTGNDGWKLSDTEAPDWQAAGFDDSSWVQPEKLGALGVAPWGIPGS